MRRTLAALLAVVVVVGTAATVPAVGAVVSSSDAQPNTAPQATTTAQTQSDNATDANASISAGERLAGAVGVQEAELEGEIGSRSFGLAVARAESPERRAALVAERLNETDRELSALQERRERLREARRNGSISQGEFAARMAELVTRGRNVERTVNQTANVSRGIPDDVLASKGVNVSAIGRLRADARNLTGPEVAEIAREIAGPPEDRGRDRAGDGERGQREEADGRERGEGESAGNASDNPRDDRAGNQTERTDGTQRESNSDAGDRGDRSQREQAGDGTQSTSGDDSDATTTVTAANSENESGADGN